MTARARIPGTRKSTGCVVPVGSTCTAGEEEQEQDRDAQGEEERLALVQDHGDLGPELGGQPPHGRGSPGAPALPAAGRRLGRSVRVSRSRREPVMAR